jgi:hypothetical protein
VEVPPYLGVASTLPNQACLEERRGVWDLRGSFFWAAERVKRGTDTATGVGGAGVQGSGTEVAPGKPDIAANIALEHGPAGFCLAGLSCGANFYPTAGVLLALLYSNEVSLFGGAASIYF